MSREIIKKSETSPAFATPENLDQAMRLAEMMAKSDLVPKDYKGKPGNCIIAMQMGAELGLAPMQAIQNIAVINGRPAVWGDSLLALVRGSGKLEWISEKLDGGSAICTVKRAGEEPVSREFSIEDAKRAGLAGKQGPWQQYPKRMLQMRARAFALRDVFPDVLKGLSMAEEVIDIPAERDNITPDKKQDVASATERVKAKLTCSKKQQKQDIEVDIDGLIKEMAQAQTIGELRAIAAKAKDLSNEEDKQRARECYRDIHEMLKEVEKKEI